MNLSCDSPETAYRSVKVRDYAGRPEIREYVGVGRERRQRRHSRSEGFHLLLVAGEGVVPGLACGALRRRGARL
ncbi:MAG TPA: hypothetical protein VG387_05250 [Rhizomicrobium sp.]|jgi:hypothetical protein|nr:hypothetical protein [Rhizomicrobium sp.]